MYASRAKEPIPYVLEGDRESAVKTFWGIRPHHARRAQEFALLRDKAARRNGLPPAEQAEEINKIDCEMLAEALCWAKNYDESGDLIEEPVRLRAIVDDLDLPTLVELVLMSQNSMGLRNAEKNS